MSREIETLGEWDWFIGERIRTLHHVTFDAPALANVQWGGPGTAACGRFDAWWSIPGMSTRMGAHRCLKCCDALGYPRGKGSPKNDPQCRPLVEARLTQSIQGDDRSKG